MIIPQSGKSSSDGDSDIFLLFPRKEQTNNNSVVASIVYVLLEIANAFIDKIPFVNIKYYRRFFRTMSIIILIKINIRKYVKYLKKMLFIPWWMSFVPNYLYSRNIRDKYNTEIRLKMNFGEYAFIRRRRCVMKDMKRAVAAQLEDLTDVILTLTGCKHLWGEPELPDCMRVEMESEEDN